MHAQALQLVGRRTQMTNFIAGCVFGFFVATYGVAGVAEFLDSALQKAKTVKVTTERT